MKRNGGLERQCASKQVVGRLSRQDEPGKSTQKGSKGLNSASTKANHLLQGANDLIATELQCISTEYGLETVKPPLENTCRKIYYAHCIIYCTHSKEREKEPCTEGIHIISVKTVRAHHCKYISRRCRKTMTGCEHRKTPFINALLNQANTVILSDTFHTISGAAKCDSDSDNKIFVKDQSKKRNSNPDSVIDDDEGSQFDGTLMSSCLAGL